MPFAQLVIGPPGSGKSTYCDGMHQFLGAIGRPSSVVNLDPANDHTSYKAALDVRSLIELEEVMRDDSLGPNGAVLHALESLEHEFEWLADGLKKLGDDYILFDCPGQVELFTHHYSLRNIFYRLQKSGYRLVVVNLVDSLVLSYPSLYVSALLLSLRSMLQLELPTINVFTKVDKIADREPLPFNLDFYTEVQDLDYLLPYLESEQRGDQISSPDLAIAPDTVPVSRFHALNVAITQLISDFGLVAFEPLFIEDKTLMASLLHTTDRASGYAFGGKVEGANESIWNVAVSQEGVKVDIGDVQERWIERRDEFDEAERKKWEEEGKKFKNGGKDEIDGKDEYEREQPHDNDTEMEALMRDQALRRGVDVGGVTVRRVGDQSK